MSELELLERVAQGVDVLVLFAVLNFVAGCIRAWRINTLKLGD